MLGIVDDADLGAAVFDVGDRHAVVAHAAQEVVRAVDRVDDPDLLRLADIRRRRLLAEERVAGKCRVEFARDKRLDRAVGARDEVLRALVLDRQRLALPEEVAGELARLARDLLRGDGTRGDRHRSISLRMRHGLLPGFDNYDAARFLV